MTVTIAMVADALIIARTAADPHLRYVDVDPASASAPNAATKTGSHQSLPRQVEPFRQTGTKTEKDGVPCSVMHLHHEGGATLPLCLRPMTKDARSLTLLPKKQSQWTRVPQKRQLRLERRLRMAKKKRWVAIHEIQHTQKGLFLCPLAFWWVVSGSRVQRQRASSAVMFSFPAVPSPRIGIRDLFSGDVHPCCHLVRPVLNHEIGM